jgi:DNA-binding IclR family transcriptional regulator
MDMEKYRPWRTLEIHLKSAGKDRAPEAAAGQATEKEKDRQYVTALARGLDILRCFSRSRPELGTAEIARITGLPQPTVWRLCHTLLQEGYLAQSDRGDKLRPGIPVLSLGYAAIAGTPIAELARTDMQALASRHQGAVALGMRDGTNMVYLQRCLGSSIVMRDLAVGSRVPLAFSATGWAYIAAMGEEEREALFEELSRAEQQRWPEVLPKIRKALRDFASTGYVVNKGTLHEQINAVAVPVVSEDGSVLLSLSAGGISQLFDDARLREVGLELKQFAARLAPALTAPR